MRVQLLHCGPHSIRDEIWFGAVTTDDTEAFEQWLVQMMPDHKIVHLRERSRIAIAIDGGYQYRINLHCSNINQQMVFKLTWGGL